MYIPSSSKRGGPWGEGSAGPTSAVPVSAAWGCGAAQGRPGLGAGYNLYASTNKPERLRAPPRTTRVRPRSDSMPIMRPLGDW